ncbi:DNA mismatch repair protein MutS [Holospora curviuscula]|nr:DNA mismatch repair protein MutS [Holospora curviuscula]
MTGPIKETPIMAQYGKIKAQYPDCLVFFRLGEFYELFDEDAKIAAQILQIVLTARHKNSSTPVPMCGVPVHASDGYIAKLVKSGYKVALCEQLDDVEEEDRASHPTKGPIHRDVVRVITPGTLTEDTLLEAKENNFLLSLVRYYPQKSSPTYVIAYVDISTGDFFIQSHPLSELEEALCALNPKEILIPEPLWKSDAVPFLLKSWKHTLTILPESRFEIEGCEHRLSVFFQVESTQGLGSFSQGEICAAGGLVDYVVLTQKRQALKLSRPKHHRQDFWVRLDPFTRKNLEIFETFSGHSTHTLARMMDRTVTAFGARLLTYRLQHPTQDLEILNTRLDSIEYFLHQDEKRTGIHSLLKNIPDLERIVTRLINGRGHPKEWLSLRQGLGMLPHLSPFLERCPLEIRPLIPHLTHYQSFHHTLCQAFQENGSQEDGWINPQYSPALKNLRRIHQDAVEILDSLQRRYIEITGINALKIKYNKIIGHYIEIPPQATSKMPFEFTLKQTLTTSARYTTGELCDMAAQLEAATQRTQALEEEIIQEFTQSLGELHGALKQACEFLGILDVSVALAELAHQHHYTRPFLDQSTVFQIEQGRHPVIEWVFFHENQKKFIANHCELTPEHPLWIMTGPNMAGKSTFLRQNALIAFMAHMGSFVPAKSAKIGCIDRIFTRVGANDDLARGHSTFMVEMLETACILNQATKKSFVILDEVGRGTSTQDGLSLAWACVEYMLENLECRTLFSTHYHELAALNYLPCVRFFTFKITEWNEQIIFFHEVVEGITDQSYGIHVARLAGMPERLLVRAQELLQQFREHPPMSSVLLKKNTLL